MFSSPWHAFTQRLSSRKGTGCVLRFAHLPHQRGSTDKICSSCMRAKSNKTTQATEQKEIRMSRVFDRCIIGEPQKYVLGQKQKTLQHTTNSSTIEVYYYRVLARTLFLPSLVVAPNKRQQQHLIDKPRFLSSLATGLSSTTNMKERTNENNTRAAVRSTRFIERSHKNQPASQSANHDTWYQVRVYVCCKRSL